MKRHIIRAVNLLVCAVLVVGMGIGTARVVSATLQQRGVSHDIGIPVTLGAAIAASLAVAAALNTVMDCQP
jgi:hypothetical protein